MNINTIMNNANTEVNPECNTSTHPGRMSYNSCPIIRSVADAISYLQFGGTWYLAQYQCHHLIEKLLLVISRGSLNNAAIAFANTCDQIFERRAELGMLSRRSCAALSRRGLTISAPGTPRRFWMDFLTYWFLVLEFHRDSIDTTTTQTTATRTQSLTLDTLYHMEWKFGTICKQLHHSGKTFPGVSLPHIFRGSCLRTLFGAVCGRADGRIDMELSCVETIKYTSRFGPSQIGSTDVGSSAVSMEVCWSCHKSFYVI